MWARVVICPFVLGLVTPELNKWSRKWMNTSDRSVLVFHNHTRDKVRWSKRHMCACFVTQMPHSKMLKRINHCMETRCLDCFLFLLYQDFMEFIFEISIFLTSLFISASFQYWGTFRLTQCLVKHILMLWHNIMILPTGHGSWITVTLIVQ